MAKFAKYFFFTGICQKMVTYELLTDGLQVGNCCQEPVIKNVNGAALNTNPLGTN